MEFRWANDQLDRLPDMAADLVRKRVSLIAHSATSACTRCERRNHKYSNSVFDGADPVRLGIVASLAKPGGNITGVTTLTSDQLQKRLQLLHDVVPGAKSFGLLVNPTNFGPTSSVGRTPVELAQDPCEAGGGTVEVEQARTVEGFDQAFANLKKKKLKPSSQHPM